MNALRNLTPERFDIAFRGLELRGDLDALLAEHRADLLIAWSGKWAMLVVRFPDGDAHPILRTSKQRAPHETACSTAAAAVRAGLYAVVRQHNARMLLAFHAGLAKLQFLFPEVPAQIGMTVLECRKERATRYVPMAEEDQGAAHA